MFYLESPSKPLSSGNLQFFRYQGHKRLGIKRHRYNSCDTLNWGTPPPFPVRFGGTRNLHREYNPTLVFTTTYHTLHPATMLRCSTEVPAYNVANHCSIRIRSLRCCWISLKRPRGEEGAERVKRASRGKMSDTSSEENIWNEQDDIDKEFFERLVRGFRRLCQAIYRSRALGQNCLWILSAKS